MANACVIYVNDGIYGKRLLNCIMGRANRKLTVDLVVGRESLKEYLANRGEGVVVDAVITDEESFYDKLYAECGGRIMILTEEQLTAKQIAAIYGDDVMGIYRYQSVDNIYRQIMDGIVVKKKQNLASTDVIGIYSPINVAPRQNFALNMAKVLSEKYKVLYINLDVFSGLSEVLPERDSGGLSDALYYYRQGKEASATKIKSTINSLGGIDYIAPAKCVEDIECMSVEELVAVINCVTKCNDYEVLVLDIYSCRGDVYKLLDICSELYMPVKDDYVSAKKLEEWERFNCETGREDIVTGAIKVKLPEGELGISKDFWEKADSGGMYRYVKKLVEQGQSGM